MCLFFFFLSIPVDRVTSGASSVRSPLRSSTLLKESSELRSCVKVECFFSFFFFFSPLRFFLRFLVVVVVVVVVAAVAAAAVVFVTSHLLFTVS